jgi:hypothetical protein
MHRFLVLPCVLAVLLVACGGGKSGQSTTATPGSAATSPAAVTATPQGTAGPTATPGPDPFAALQGYRYQMGLVANGESQLTIKGTVKEPNSFSIEFYPAGSNAAANSVTVIGDQAWAEDSTSGGWQPVDVAEVEGQLGPILPGTLWGSLLTNELVTEGTGVGAEDVNGVATRHLTIAQLDSSTLGKLTETFVGTGGPAPDSGSMDLWLAENGAWPAKADTKLSFPSGSDLSSAEITWEVSDVNGPDISIQPPPVATPTP